MDKIPTPKTGIQRVFKAFFYSMDGLSHGLKNEAAFRQEVFFCIILIPLSLLLPVSSLLKLILVLSHLLVLITELLNSAIEAVVDKVCPQYDILAKQAKDMGSAAVFISLLGAGMVWAVIFYSCWH